MHWPLLVLPTGTGKTIVFALLVQRRRGRSLILAHRDELIQQAVDRLRLVDPTLGAYYLLAHEQDGRADSGAPPPPDPSPPPEEPRHAPTSASTKQRHGAALAGPREAIGVSGGCWGERVP